MLGKFSPSEPHTVFEASALRSLSLSRLPHSTVPHTHICLPICSHHTHAHIHSHSPAFSLTEVFSEPGWAWVRGWASPALSVVLGCEVHREFHYPHSCQRGVVRVKPQGLGVYFGGGVRSCLECTKLWAQSQLYKPDIAPHACNLSSLIEERSSLAKFVASLSYMKQCLKKEGDNCAVFWVWVASYPT